MDQCSWMEGPILLGNELIQIIFNLVHHESINIDYLQNIHFLHKFFSLTVLYCLPYFSTVFVYNFIRISF